MLNIAKHPLNAREALDTSLSNIRDLKKSWTKKDYLIWRGPRGEFKDKDHQQLHQKSQSWGGSRAEAKERFPLDLNDNCLTIRVTLSNS